MDRVRRRKLAVQRELKAVELLDLRFLRDQPLAHHVRYHLRDIGGVVLHDLEPAKLDRIQLGAVGEIPLDAIDVLDASDEARQGEPRFPGSHRIGAVALHDVRVGRPARELRGVGQLRVRAVVRVQVALHLSAYRS